MREFDRVLVFKSLFSFASWADLEPRDLVPFGSSDEAPFCVRCSMVLAALSRPLKSNAETVIVNTIIEMRLAQNVITQSNKK